MRACICLLAALCSFCPGQWLEREVVLPDSLSGLSRPGGFLYSPVSNTILVSGDGSGCVIVLDAATAVRVARISLPGNATAMCLAEAQGKAYAAMPGAGAVAVIDVIANQVVATVPVSGVVDVAFNPAMNRVYCSYEYPGGVKAIDCAADTLVADIGLLSPVRDLCYNPVGNKLYCMANRDEVAVINCDSDSVMRSIYSGLGPYDMVLNPANNHLYITEADDEDVTVIDAGTDTVIRWMPSGDEPAAACLASRHNKLYVADEGTNNLYVYNCNTDSFLRWFSIGGRSTDVVYDSIDDLVWAAVPDFNRLVAVDASADTIVFRVPVGAEPETLGYCPVSGRVFSGNASGSVSVVDAGAGQAETTYALWFPPGALAACDPHNRVYVAGGEGGRFLAALDAFGLEVEDRLRVGGETDILFYNSPTDRLYCANNDWSDPNVYVVRCADESVVPVSAGVRVTDFCYNPDANKVYCSSGDDLDRIIAVLDAGADSLLGRIAVNRPVWVLAFSPVRNRLYAALSGCDTLLVIDGGADTVVGRVRVAGEPTSLEYVPGRDWVCAASWYSDSVTVIDCALDSVLAVIPVGSVPEDLMYNPVSDKLYTADTYADTVTVIDCASLRVAASVPVAYYPTELLLDSVANKVYCLHEYEDIVTAIDGRTNNIVTTVPVRPYCGGMAWSYATRRLFVSHPVYSLLSVVTDTAHVGIAGEPVSAARTMPTVVRGVLNCQLPVSGCRWPMVLLDAAGRKVMELQPGANDVRHLAPGVYFVRSVTGAAPARVLVVR